MYTGGAHPTSQALSDNSNALQQQNLGATIAENSAVGYLNQT